MTISGLVSEHVSEVMLGIDWLRGNEVRWDFVRGEVNVQGEVYKLAARRTPVSYTHLTLPTIYSV